MNEDQGNFIKKAFNSRKFIVFLVASILFAFGNIDVDLWWKISAIYLAAQGGVDAVTALRRPSGTPGDGVYIPFTKDDPK